MNMYNNYCYSWKATDNYCVMFVNSTGVKKSSWVIEVAIIKVKNNEIIDTFTSKVKPLSSRKDIKEKYKDYMQYKTLAQIMPDIQKFIGKLCVIGWCIDFIDDIVYHDTKMYIENRFIDLFIPYKRYYNYNLGDWFYCSMENVYKESFREKAKPYNFENPYDRCLVCKELYEHRKDFNKFLAEMRKETREFKIKNNLI